MVDDTSSAWATESASDLESTAFYLEWDTLDACGGHATTEGWYHYHGTPGCLEEQVMIGEGLAMDDHSPFPGWSYVRVNPSAPQVPPNVRFKTACLYKRD